jgi:hypothetical protein
LIEVLLGLALALCLAIGVAPLWSSFQALGAREGDATIWALQGRVAAARLEKDLRLADLQGCPFRGANTVLQATPSQVVLLVADPGATAPLLVEWELVNGCLMRRWGVCPSTCPASFSHSLYSDSKTMLEDVDVARSGFLYLTAGHAAAAPVAAADLPLIDSVSVDVACSLSGAIDVLPVRATGSVAR